MQRVWTLQNKKYSQAEDLQKCFICHELGPKFHISLPSFGKGKTELSIFQADRSLCDHD